MKPGLVLEFQNAGSGVEADESYKTRSPGRGRNRDSSRFELGLMHKNLIGRNRIHPNPDSVGVEFQN